MNALRLLRLSTPLLALPALSRGAEELVNTPPPVAQALPGAIQPTIPSGAQQSYGPVAEALVPKAAAERVLAAYRQSLAGSAAPRIVVYVNRALVDSTGGLRLTGHTEQYEKTDAGTRTTGTNTYRVESGATASLADRQTVREIERLLGRVFRQAGAQLADPALAADLLPSQAGTHLVEDRAARDREALAKVADVAIEVLLASRPLPVTRLSGDTSVTVPDLQLTAIRLKDAVIIGQAAASDVIGKGESAAQTATRFDVRDITEATALALMEDMLTGRK
jgi:hypothetical protein